MIPKAALLVGLLAFGDVGAVTMTIINKDGPDEGLNDPTPVLPVTGNPATTLGEQRLVALQAAADYWGAALTSTVPVRITARFDSLDCNANSATLGQTGPVSAVRDFRGAPRANTWYVLALGNSLAAFDLNPTSDDIDSSFNGDIGSPGCLESISWWYGVGGGTPSGHLSLYETALHELAHGLGFITFVDSDGTKALGFDDAFMVNLEDHSKGKIWPDLTDGERGASSIDTGDLHWVGSNAVGAAEFLTSGRHASGHVRMFAPNPYQPGSSVSHWDTVLSPDELLEPSKTLTSDDRLTKEAFRDLGWIVVSSGISFSLDVAVSGSGNVSSNPGGISCPGDCQESYSQGSMVQLTAAPDEGWSFSGWSGACTGLSQNCSVTMSSAKSVTASFSENQPNHLLTVAVTGSGNVSSNPAGIACPADCQESYSQVAVIELTAAPSNGWLFSGWSGACVGSSLSCNVTMSAARNVGATFAEDQASHTLTVSVSGPGGVTSVPAGIGCPGDCQEVYSQGTIVGLMASPASGGEFLGWSGACSGILSSCSVTMSAPRGVTASFGDPVLPKVATTVPGTACGAFINAQADKLERQQARIFNPLGHSQALWVVCPIQSPLSVGAGEMGVAEEVVDGRVGIWWGDGAAPGSEVSCAIRRYSSFSTHLPGVSQDGVVDVTTVMSAYDDARDAPYVDSRSFLLDSGEVAASPWYITVTCQLPPGAGINTITAGYGEAP